MTARLIVGLVRLRQLRQSCVEINVDDLDPSLRSLIAELNAAHSFHSRPVSLSVSSQIRVPAAIGLWNPTIALPYGRFAICRPPISASFFVTSSRTCATGTIGPISSKSYYAFFSSFIPPFGGLKIASRSNARWHATMSSSLKPPTPRDMRAALCPSWKEVLPGALDHAQALSIALRGFDPHRADPRQQSPRRYRISKPALAWLEPSPFFVWSCSPTRRR